MFQEQRGKALEEEGVKGLGDAGGAGGGGGEAAVPVADHHGAAGGVGRARVQQFAAGAGVVGHGGGEVGLMGLSTCMVKWHMVFPLLNSRSQ